MPRRTRTRKQRRLAAYAQRQRERDLTQLGRELRSLWWQYEAVNSSEGPRAGNAGYADSELALWSPGAA